MPFEINESKLDQSIKAKEPESFFKKILLKIDSKVDNFENFLGVITLGGVYILLGLLCLLILAVILGLVFAFLRFSWNLF